MAYQIKAVIINEDNGKENVYYGANFYEVKAVADYFANKEAMEIGEYGCGDAGLEDAEMAMIEAIAQYRMN